MGSTVLLASWEKHFIRACENLPATLDCSIYLRKCGSSPHVRILLQVVTLGGREMNYSPPRSQHQSYSAQFRCDYILAGRGQWAGYFTSPHSVQKCFHIRWLNNFEELLLNFDLLVYQVRAYRRCNFVYFVCKSIYRPLSHPFRSLYSTPCIDMYMYKFKKVEMHPSYCICLEKLFREIWVKFW